MKLYQVDEFVAWLNSKGVRELALKNAFTKWWSHIAPGMRKRLSVCDVANSEERQTKFAVGSERECQTPRSPPFDKSQDDGWT